MTEALPGGSIRVEGVGKRYVKYEDSPTLVYGLLRSGRRKRRERLWALQDASFSIEPGESVGILGRNGSGKTTLMSMLCGVTGPTTGRIQVAGRIAPLISVGVGFHPELTGRENVYVNATILGLTKTQIDARLEEIIDFAEVEAFIDTPVKFYSSGMFLRLGFSVAAHVDPDVLLIDEILAVGDMGFQIKCFRHLKRLRRAGVTVVMVSHNLPALEAYCDRGLLIDRGCLLSDGPISESVVLFNELMHGSAQSSADSEALRPDDDVLDLSAVEIVDARLYAEDGTHRSTFDAGEMAELRVTIRSHQPISAPFLQVGLISQDGVVVYYEANAISPYPALRAGGQTNLAVRVSLRLATGQYQISFVLARVAGPEVSGLAAAERRVRLSTEQRVPLYVRGRQTALGLADLQAEFVRSNDNVGD